ncbi:hypothetical protein [Saccharothrix sp. ALI-22-I]|uniref:hypothetical protein n=1 Tax=Saccharothrix sp. ALI-22-I TaxID=1933778 RepID=UPI00117A6ED9|nr:hypothetical protein [Saccharothrix sp. ALI-22-I]
MADEVGSAEVQRLGGGLQPGRIGVVGPGSGADAGLQCEQARHLFGRGEGAVPGPCDVGLAQQARAAGAGDFSGVLALELGGHQVVGDGVQVEFGHRRPTGRGGRACHPPDRSEVGCDRRAPGQDAEIGAEVKACLPVRGGTRVPFQSAGTSAIHVAPSGSVPAR